MGLSSPSTSGLRSRLVSLVSGCGWPTCRDLRARGAVGSFAQPGYGSRLDQPRTMELEQRVDAPQRPTPEAVIALGDHVFADAREPGRGRDRWRIGASPEREQLSGPM